MLLAERSDAGAHDVSAARSGRPGVLAKEDGIVLREGLLKHGPLFTPASISRRDSHRNRAVRVYPGEPAGQRMVTPESSRTDPGLPGGRAVVSFRRPLDRTPGN